MKKILTVFLLVFILCFAVSCGDDSPLMEISEDGYWVIGGEKTNLKAHGEKGDKGDTGEQGLKGDKGDTGEKGDKGDTGEQGLKGDKGDTGEQGLKGDKGDTGEQGLKGDKGDKGDTGATIEKVEFDADGNLVITLTNGTVLDPIELPEKEEKPEEPAHQHSFGAWQLYSGNCEGGLFLAFCSGCRQVEWKQGTADDHVLKDGYYSDGSKHWKKCKNCNTALSLDVHIDNNVDYECDVCNAILEHTCVDANKDTLCDVCFEDMPIPKCNQCIDKKGDGICDVCESEVNCDHEDADGDTTCDYCECYVAPQNNEIDFTSKWKNTKLVMQLTKNTNDDELYSVSDKYLSGELDDGGDISKAVRLRNNQAEYTTNVDITYYYYPNTAAYSWGQTIALIEKDVQKGGSTAPDIYALFIYDMVGASLKGCFANLITTASRPGNYFEFNDANYDPARNDLGYMYEYMESLTLAPGKKMYVLSSDYFIDMVRAFFCIPVSIELMNNNCASVVSKNAAGKIVYAGGDRNGDGEFDIEDFYKLVLNGEWTYDRLAAFASAVHKPASTSSGACKISDDVVGFAIDDGGLAASGLLYTSSVSLIEKNLNATEISDRYNYPSSNPEFVAFSLKAKELFGGETKGVCVVNKHTNYKEYGSDANLAIRKRFSENKVLFGDIVILGSLEFSAYQNMKRESDGFGVVPVPVYRDGDRYLTQIHNMGICGAISIKTGEYPQCTAFLNYQSTNSEAVIENYYNYNVKCGLATDSDGTVEMLQYLRENVRSSFDKAMEDAIGVFQPGAIKWHNVLSKANYAIDVSTTYNTYYATKEAQLDALVAAFQTFED